MKLYLTICSTIVFLIICSYGYAGGGGFQTRMMEQKSILEDAYEKYVPEKVVRPKATKVREEFVSTASIESVEEVASEPDEGKKPPKWLINIIAWLLTMFPAPVIAAAIATGMVGNAVLVKVFWVYVDKKIKKVMG